MTHWSKQSTGDRMRERYPKAHSPISQAPSIVMAVAIRVNWSWCTRGALVVSLLTPVKPPSFVPFFLTVVSILNFPIISINSTQYRHFASFVFFLFMNQMMPSGYWPKSLTTLTLFICDNIFWILRTRIFNGLRWKVLVKWKLAYNIQVLI